MFSLFCISARTKSFTRQDEKHFLQWMRQNSFVFTGEEYQHRFNIWLNNKKFIQEHNKGDSTFRLELNKYAHLTPGYHILDGHLLLDFHFSGRKEYVCHR